MHGQTSHIANERRKRRRNRRRKVRGRMRPSEVTIAKRARADYPVTATPRRYHRLKSYWENRD
jgi:hypothetical protein